MKRKQGILMLSGAYVLMLNSMFILPLFMVPDQSILRNTLTELGAQSSPYSWIMNSIFAALALGSVTAGWGSFKGFAFQRIIIVLFGVFLTLSAILNHAPTDPDIKYNISEDGLHSYFTGTTWLTFVILTFSTVPVLEKSEDKLISIATGIAAIVLSLLMFEAEMAAGIWQRLLFIISFGWMIYCFNPRRPSLISKTEVTRISPDQKGRSRTEDTHLIN
jgi:hypothetical protein